MPEIVNETIPRDETPKYDFRSDFLKLKEQTEKWTKKPRGQQQPLLKLIRGTDFDIETDSMSHYLHRIYRGEMGLPISISKSPLHPDTLWVKWNIE